MMWPLTLISATYVSSTHLTELMLYILDCCSPHQIPINLNSIACTDYQMGHNEFEKIAILLTYLRWGDRDVATLISSEFLDQRQI